MRTKPKNLPPITEKDVVRFWKYVDRRGEEECWIWLGGLVPSQTGAVYGQFHLHGRPAYAHRVAFTIGNGSIPEGLTIDHVRDRCTIGSLCQNPKHLEAVTQGENVRRHYRRVTVCKRGHDKPPMTGTCMICKRDNDRMRVALKRQHQKQADPIPTSEVIQ